VHKNSFRFFFSALVAMFSVSICSAQTATDSPTPAVNPEIIARAETPTPVKFRDQTLFEVAMPIGAFTAQERAAAIERRLLVVAKGPASVLGDLRVVERGGLSEIIAGEKLIRTLTDADTAGTGRTRRQLAADQALLIREALALEFRGRSAANLLRSAVYALLATLLLVVSIVALRRLYRWAHYRVTTAAKGWSWEKGFAHLALLSPSALSAASRSVAATTAWLIAIVLVYLYLEYTLSLFPWTRGIAESMLTTTRAAVVRVGSGLIDYLPSLLNIAVIIIVARLLLRAVRVLFEQVHAGRLEMGGFYAEWAMPTYSLLRFFVIAVAAVMVFPYLPGSGSEGFKGVSVFVGLLISLGAASAIANLIAGIVITYMRPFRVGDRVKIADAFGDVINKDLFVVRLRTIKNVDITIPNSLVLANHIINFSSSAQIHGLILNTKVTIGYDVDWRKVHELLLTAAKRVEALMPEPAPFVLQISLDDFYVSYELNAYTKAPAQMAVTYSQLHAEIQNAFAEAGVEIMSPHYTAARDGNAAAIPAEHLPKDYAVPAFNIFSQLQRGPAPKS
jgi:small-conductance mechanosensitive channel